MNANAMKMCAWLPFAMALAACGSITTGSQSQEPQTTWTISVGASSSDFALQGLNYYPATMTIDAGDSIVWKIASSEPHTVTLLGPGQTPPPPTPQNLVPAGGSSYDGSAYVSSGLIARGASYRLMFPKAGTYKVYCLIHQPEMLLIVTVQPAGTLHPKNQAQYTAQGQAAASSDLTQAQNALSQFPYATGGPHLAAGIAPGLASAPPGNSTVLRFLDAPSVSPTNVSVAVGTSVTWTNLTTNEIHTVTFGIAGKPFPKLDPFGPPLGGSTYDGTVITSSGIMTPGGNYALTFTKAGTYTYHCLFHDDDSNMIATVTVH
jgi:plastocyanin